MNKRALSPLVATLLLVMFSLAVGTVTMNWGKTYVEKIKEETETVGSTKESAIIISVEDINTPPSDASLKKLQIEYITGKITKEEYLTKEKVVISG